MSFEWLGNSAIRYDGHILYFDPNNEWGPSDAINDYERKKREQQAADEARLRCIIREEVRKALKDGG